jgi:hypothetical protein
MSRSEAPTVRAFERDWLLLINRRAAAKEQFPSVAKVLKERPGSATDRVQQEIHAAQNRASVEAGDRSWLKRQQDARAALADADRFIAERRRAQLEKDRARHALRVKANAWARAHDEERKTA